MATTLLSSPSPTRDDHGELAAVVAGRQMRGSPWENGYIESFNARLRDELLNGEIFYTLREAQTCLRRVAGCATPTGSAGHASATASLKLTFHLDHSVGANQFRGPLSRVSSVRAIMQPPRDLNRHSKRPA